MPAETEAARGFLPIDARTGSGLFPSEDQAGNGSSPTKSSCKRFSPVNARAEVVSSLRSPNWKWFLSYEIKQQAFLADRPIDAEPKWSPARKNACCKRLLARRNSGRPVLSIRPHCRRPRKDRHATEPTTAQRVIVATCERRPANCWRLFLPA